MRGPRAWERGGRRGFLRTRPIHPQCSCSRAQPSPAPGSAAQTPGTAWLTGSPLLTETRHSGRGTGNVLVSPCSSVSSWTPGHARVPQGHAQSAGVGDNHCTRTVDGPKHSRFIPKRHRGAATPWRQWRCQRCCHALSPAMALPALATGTWHCRVAPAAAQSIPSACL